MKVIKIPHSSHSSKRQLYISIVTAVNFVVAVQSVVTVLLSTFLSNSWLLLFDYFFLLSWLQKSYENADATMLLLGDIVVVAINLFIFIFDAGFVLKPHALVTWTVFNFAVMLLPTQLPLLLWLLPAWLLTLKTFCLHPGHPLIIGCWSLHWANADGIFSAIAVGQLLALILNCSHLLRLPSLVPSPPVDCYSCQWCWSSPTAWWYFAHAICWLLLFTFLVAGLLRPIAIATSLSTAAYCC